MFPKFILYFARCGKHNISFGETKVLGILPHLKFYFLSIFGMLEKFLVLGEGRTPFHVLYGFQAHLVWYNIWMGILEAIV